MTRDRGLMGLLFDGTFCTSSINFLDFLFQLSESMTSDEFLMNAPAYCVKKSRHKY
jgi:hypothetical protein